MRKAFFRRVTTKCAASSLVRAASDRKSGFGFSCSKYSTRHGHQSASISDFGNCIRSFKLDARLQIIAPKSSGFCRSTDKEKIAFGGATALGGSQPFLRVALQLREQAVDLVIGENERIEFTGIPVRGRLGWLEELRSPNIQKHSFFFATDHAIAPLMFAGFLHDSAAENSERLALLPFRYRHFLDGVTAREDRGQDNRYGRTALDD